MRSAHAGRRSSSKANSPLLALVVGGLIAATIAGGAGRAGAATAAPNTFSWLSRCVYTRSARVDPIMSPGMPSMHLHDFFGTAPGMDATYDSLRAGNTNCFLAEETAGYWAPALYTRDAAGKYVHRLPATRGLSGPTSLRPPRTRTPGIVPRWATAASTSSTTKHR